MNYGKYGKSLGTWWGKLKITAGMISLYITGFNFILLTVTAYPVITDWLHDKNVVIPFWQFESVVILAVCILLFLEYKFSLPGYYRASNEQTWRNDNPIKVEILALRKENEELKKELKDIKTILEDIKNK